MSVLEFRVGDVVRLRKAHPCGGLVWTVLRLGADIGLRCNTCDRRVLFDRVPLEKRVREFIHRGEAVASVREHDNAPDRSR